MPLPLITERLLIRPLTLDELDDYAAIVADPKVQTWLNEGRPRDRNYASDYLINLINIQKDNGFSRYGVFDKSTKTLLGHCGFEDLEGRIDIGWTLAQNVWGKGIGTEAAAEVLRFGFEALGFDRITARAFRENVASIAIMKRIGMSFDKTIPWEWGEEDYPMSSKLTLDQYEITRTADISDC